MNMEYLGPFSLHTYITWWYITLLFINCYCSTCQRAKELWSNILKAKFLAVEDHQIYTLKIWKWIITSNFVVRFQIPFDLLLSYNPIYYLDHRNSDLSELLFGGLFPSVYKVDSCFCESVYIRESALFATWSRFLGIHWSLIASK